MKTQDEQSRGDCDPWRDRLSEYLDDDLTSGERVQLEAHLAVCVECATVVEDLGHIVARARIPEIVSEPVRDLWPGIQARLVRPAPPRSIPTRWKTRVGGARHTQQRFWFPFGLPVAAMLAIACIGFVTWLAMRSSSSTAPAMTSAPSTAAVAVGQSDREYDDTLSDLRRVVQARLTRDPHVLEVIDNNLAAIDVAIAEYRDVLARQPDDTDLSRRLVAAKERKLVLLRHAASLAPEGTD